MTKAETFEIFLMTAPGLESALCAEVRLKGFKQPKTVAGGVIIKGGWPEVWRANLWIRGAGRILARIGAFHAIHLSQLDARAHAVPWEKFLLPNEPFNIEVTCKKSRIYHSDAAAQRIATAIQDSIGACYNPEAEVLVRARIEHDMCTLSIDTSGLPLHKRGYKEAINKAPLRETMASLFLKQCEFNGTEPVVDPMCGSGTFVIEAAEIAARLNPGRARSFAFEKLATFNAQAWDQMRGVNSQRVPESRFYGTDRDAGAITMSQDNALRAGVMAYTEFKQCSITALTAPTEAKGLVITNPPYGSRIGDKSNLTHLYQALGQTLKTRFSGWRVGIVTNEPSLAFATGLPFLPTGSPVPHGGLKITLYRTGTLS